MDASLYRNPPAAIVPREQTALSVGVGHATEATDGRLNEDFFGVVIPATEASMGKGIAAAIADGLSGASGGRVAAESVVRSVLSDYYAFSAHWEVPMVLDRIIQPLNAWLLAQNRMHAELEGMATTLSVLVLRGDRYYLAHAGDTRIYLWREDRLVQLTIDHVWTRRSMHHVVKRAVGLDEHLFMQYQSDELRAGDVFVLLSDGVWEVVGDPFLRETLVCQPDPQALAQTLIDQAMTRGGQYLGALDATAAVLKVLSI